ncbi:hypothetical protein E2I00_016690 [Balaenoptera physalus]|uniref:Uncharacterized protein n=1 Tax=Balaenoptera physalus TaxID=9770 RepID=A0A6A1QB61_BALPH|nr:hypothetical protein E2I00_016690 [Balaenoptera physalus]
MRKQLKVVSKKKRKMLQKDAQEKKGRAAGKGRKGHQTLRKDKALPFKENLPPRTDCKEFDHDFAISIPSMGSTTLSGTTVEFARFQTEAAATFGVIFFLRNIVSKVLHPQEISTNSTGSKEAIDFLASEQNFSITSTLLECDFFGKPWGPEDFAHVFTEYGNCLNHGENIQAKKKVFLEEACLSLLFNVNWEEFTDDATLGFVDAGIIFIIHSRRKVPQFDGLSLPSPVGMHARVTLRQVQTAQQEYPWGECNAHMKLQNLRTYSTSGCLQERKAWHIEKQCGCLSFLLPGNGVECDLQKFYNCTTLKLRDYEQWEHIIPAALFLVKKQNTLLPFLILLFRVKKDNLVNIEINHSDLNYKVTQQQKAVSVSELLGLAYQWRKGVPRACGSPAAKVTGVLTSKGRGSSCPRHTQHLLPLRCAPTPSWRSAGPILWASVITIIEITECIFTGFYWMCILFLLKISEMSQGATAPQIHLGNKNSIQEC